MADGVSGPRSIGESIGDRMAANERRYNMRFYESYRDTLGRLHREGALPAASYDINDARGDEARDAGEKLLSNMPFARAVGDEARDWFKEQPAARQALVTTFHLVRARRLELGRTIRFGDDGERVRLRGILDGRSDRIEARYVKPTYLGDVEVDTTIRRGLEKPGHTTRVGLRAPCGVSCKRIDLVSERRDDNPQQRHVLSLTGSVVHNNGVALFGGVERIKDAQSKSHTRIGVGLTFAYL